MPELPDVETMRRYFERTSLGREVAYVDAIAPRVLDNTTPGELQAAFKGKRFASARRHGKYLFASAGGLWLVLHFGMTGALAFKESGPLPAHTRVVFGFIGGSRLCFVDTRMFGRAGITEDIDEFIKRKKLGPDALSMGFGPFRAALGRTKRA